MNAETPDVRPPGTAVATGPFASRLGWRVEHPDDSSVRIGLEFAEAISNGDGALHGGIAASTAAAAATELAARTLGPGAGPLHLPAFHISYVAAAVNEGLEATARLARAGRELVHSTVEVTGPGGRLLAAAVALVRGRFGEPEPALAPVDAVTGDDPGVMGPFVSAVPFHATLGMTVEHMADGTSRIRLPDGEHTAGPHGGPADGAVLALIDTTGAMAAWARTGPGRFKASTPAMQAHLLVPAPPGGLTGHGRVRHHDRELLVSDVSVAAEATGQVVATGTVIYRIVTPEHRR